MSDYEELRAFRWEFYRELANELGTVREQGPASDTVWDERDHFERLLVEREDPAFARELDRYAELSEVLEQPTISDEEYQQKAMSHIPSKFVDVGYDDHFSIDYPRRGDHEDYIAFRDYVDMYSEGIIYAEDASALRDRIVEDNDHWTLQFEEECPTWYEHVWDAVNAGEPSIREKKRTQSSIRNMKQAELEELVDTLYERVGEKIETHLLEGEERSLEDIMEAVTDDRRAS